MIHDTKHSSKEIVKRAEDSISVVAMTVYNPLALVRVPIAFWMFLLCRMSRVAIIVVRRRLSTRESTKYVMVNTCTIRGISPCHHAGCVDW